VLIADINAENGERSLAKAKRAGFAAVGQLQRGARFVGPSAYAGCNWI
jgi:hypothetical protein